MLKGTLLRTVKIDGRVDEIFELQDRIVFDLSRSLNVKLGKAEADAIERDETSSVEAFEAYSRGVLNLRTAGRDAIDRAIALFERAVQLDPKYASAWAALGGAYTLKGGFLGMTQLLEKAIEPLRRALALNPTLVNAHVWLGSALSGLGRLDEGLVSLRKAVEIEPDNADAHQNLARAYWLSQGDGARGDRRAAQGAHASIPKLGIRTCSSRCSKRSAATSTQQKKRRVRRSSFKSGRCRVPKGC